VARILLTGWPSLGKANGELAMSDTASKQSGMTLLESLPLSEASVQDIQLELIRRRRFHEFDGRRVVACLLENRDLWEAVMMDRLAISHPGSLPTMGLMKLRAFSCGEWNVDTLYILTRTEEDARRLADIFRKRHLGGMVTVYADPEEVDNALGGAKPGQAVVTVWWE
jgi:hypothetical protein